MRSALWRIRHDPAALTGAIFLLCLVLIAIIGPLFVTDIAREQNLQSVGVRPFSGEGGFLGALGTDSLGRSVLARLIVASQFTLVIAVGATVIAATLGTLIGMVAGYAGGIFSVIVLRAADVILSFPSIILAVVVLYIASPSIGSMIFVLAFTRLPIYIRVSRGLGLRLREEQFVLAARGLGISGLRTIWAHIAPNTIPTVVTLVSLDIGFVMLIESGLSFLGIGLQPPDISWGLMVSQGQGYLQNYWWLSVFPGLAIVLTTLSFTAISAAVRRGTTLPEAGALRRFRKPRAPRRTTPHTETEGMENT